MTALGNLYGLVHTNRQGKDLWGKNQFNSTFPASLACLMRDKKINAIYIKSTPALKTQCTEISIDALFNSSEPNENLFFDFESCYEPYQKLVEHGLERVDLVLRNLAKKSDKPVAGDALRPLEVKLTVVPDNATCENPEDEWFPEIVIRPATIMYCCMSIASTLTQEEAKFLFNSMGKNVRQWGNSVEAIKLIPEILRALNCMQEAYCSRQQPLVLQPIWRTKGKQPILDEHAFDLFVWSDYALLRVVLDAVLKNQEKITRFTRSVLRISRYLYEYGRAGSAHINNIFSDMTYGLQSDKEFSINGSITKDYMNHPRMQKPILAKKTVYEIILGGGETQLSPERRLDQTIYFAYRESANASA